MPKRYSTVTISDPCSMHHTVRLYPSQDLTLRLSSELKNLRTDPFLQIKGQKVLDQGVEVNFEQKPEIITWGRDSSVYLGEINGETSMGTKFRLCVYMISDNDYKKDVVTVFNPVNQVIKLEPYQIIEVILSDPYFGGSDVWEIEHEDEHRELDIGFHELGKRNVTLARSSIADDRDKSDIYHLKTRTKDFWHPCCREHHFWLRFDNRMLPLVRTRSNRIYFVGHMNFIGYSSEAKDDDFKAKRSLEVWLNIKNKHAHRVAQLLGIRDFGDVSAQPDTKVFLPIVTPLRNESRKGRYSPQPRHYSETTRSYGNYGAWQGSEGYDFATNYSPYVSSFKEIRKIDIEEIQDPVLGVNCKASSLIPVGKKKPAALIPYDWSDGDDHIPD